MEGPPNYVRAPAVGKRALLVLDGQEWRQRPTPPDHHFRSVAHFYRKVLSYGAPPAQIPTERHDVQQEKLPFEGLFAESDGRTRVYWFAPTGPIYFDAAGGSWGQPEGPVIHQISDFWTKRVDRANSLPAWVRGGGSTARGPDGRIYLTGGIGREFGATHPEVVLSAVEIYDPRTDSWTIGAPMSRPRQVHASTFGTDGKLYVFGGCACVGGLVATSGSDPAVNARAALELLEESHSIALTEVYDPAADRWEPRAPMPTPRQELTAATGRDGLIYVIGGSRGYAEPGVDTVEIYNPATDTWSEGPSLRRPRQGHASAVTPDGRIWVTGGLSPGPTLREPMRLLRGDKAGAQTSVEFLETLPEPK